MKFCLYKYKQNYNGKRKEIIDSFNMLKKNKNKKIKPYLELIKQIEKVRILWNALGFY